MKMLGKVLKWAALTFFGALLLLGFGLTWPLEVLVFMGTGWARFLARVLPQVHLNGLALAEALVVLAVLAGGLHLFLGRLWRRWHEAMPGARPWPVRWSASLVALLILLFGATMASVGMAHHVGWMVTSPEPLVRSSWRFVPSLMEQRAESLCREAWQWVELRGPVNRIVSNMLQAPGTAASFEQWAVIVWRDETGETSVVVFARDPIIREHSASLRCGPAGKVEVLPAEELSRVLETIQAGGGASTSPM